MQEASNKEQVLQQQMSLRYHMQAEVLGDSVKICNCELCNKKILLQMSMSKVKCCFDSLAKKAGNCRR